VAHPRYDGFGGLPFNIEYIVRKLEPMFGDEIKLWEIPPLGTEAADRLRLRVLEASDAPLAAQI
jgi:hypothetical protein